MQIAQWLKTAPPDNITAVSIEAVVSYGRRVQSAFKDGVFPAGSLFEQFPPAARAQIARYMRSLNTVMGTTAEHARDAPTNHMHKSSDEREAIEKSLAEMEDLASAVSTAVETPLLLGSSNGRGTALSIEHVDTYDDDRFYGLVAATDADAAIILRQAVLADGPCRYSSEISRDKIVFDSPPTHRGGSSSNNLHHRRFRFGTIDGRPVIMDKYKYRETPDHSGEPYPQAVQQVRKMTGLLCHPKRKGFRILPCAGFFRDRVRQELGLVFETPPTFDPEEASDGFVTLVELYKKHKLVALGQRIHLAWLLATAVEQFHRVGWVHKNIRSDVIAFMAVGRETPKPDAAAPAQESPVGRFDLGKPYLFGFEYARAGDGTTFLGEDHSLANNLYRHPDRWGRPTSRFEKSHDMYALGVVLLEIALWKDVGVVFKTFLDGAPVVAAEVAEAMMQRCRKTLPHQVGDVFAQSILTCLEFGARTKGLGEYEAQVYFQENVVRLLKKVVRRV